MNYAISCIFSPGTSLLRRPILAAALARVALIRIPQRPTALPVPRAPTRFSQLCPRFFIFDKYRGHLAYVTDYINASKYKSRSCIS